MRQVTVVLLLLGVCSLASSAPAAVVIGGSTLLSGGDANQLESWLGEGPITLTRIFSKAIGDGQTSLDFHAAVDGMGRTFSVIKVGAIDGSNYSITDTQLIGGYNPQSWDSVSDDHLTPTDAERTAFLFNLTSAEQQLQKLNSNPNPGSYQTRNVIGNGPTFGAGHDLYTDTSLEYGFAYNYTYGPDVFTDNITTGPQAYSDLSDFTVSGIEIFTISGESAVPEPSSLIVWTVLGLVGAVAFRRLKEVA